MLRMMTAFFLSMLCIILSGCGYNMGSIAHPQLTSIAIAETVNETPEASVPYWVRQHCAEEFQVDGSMNVLSKGDADCILYTRVLNITSTQKARTSTNNEMTFRGRSWEVTAEIEFTLIIPGRTTPVFTKIARGVSLYQVLYDQEVHRRRAMEAAIREAARDIVRQTVEGW